MILPLRNTIQNYPWGSKTELSELFGIPNPKNEPQAELWLGAHPKSPSQVLYKDEWSLLNEAIADDPTLLLGAELAQKTDTLPFLLKILCADMPLSIQTHPDSAQAKEGFARENAEGIDLLAPNRNYRDPFPKPETIFPITTFHGLSGLRPYHDIADNLEYVCPITLRDEICALRKTADVEQLLRQLAQAPTDRIETVLSELAATLKIKKSVPERYWLSRLLVLYPTDGLVLSPLILNHVTLEKGQSLHNAAGVLHAWLDGTTVEIMANSDNVLRAGLTHKHIEEDELFRVMDFSPEQQPHIKVNERRHEIPGYYRFSRLMPHRGCTIPYSDTPTIIMTTRGSIDIERNDETKTLELGESAFLPPGADATCKGMGNLIVASASLK